MFFIKFGVSNLNFLKFCKRFFAILFAALLVVVEANPVTKLETDSCKAFYRGKATKGQCISLRKCPVLLKILNSPVINSYEILLLQELTCVHDFEDPKVCCAEQDIDLHKNTGGSGNRNSVEKPAVANGSSNEFSSENLKIIVDRNNIPSPSSPVADVKKIVHENFKLLPSIEECGVTGSVERIVGGTNAPLGAHPWMALIAYRDRGTDEIHFFCGGTIINNRHVLTAAHCVTEKVNGNYDVEFIRIGEHDIGKEIECDPVLNCSRAQDIGVEKIIIHEHYEPSNKTDDIALIKLSQTIDLSSIFITPICLPFYSEYGFDDKFDEIKFLSSQKAWVTGWGRKKWHRVRGSLILQEVKLPIVSNEDCKTSYDSKIDVTERQLCAGGIRKQDSCAGDSGGPLILPVLVPPLRQMQFGIVSFGPIHCGHGNLPGVYTRVSSYKNWILDNLS